MKFKDFIKKYEKEESPLGDLACDIAGDKTFPDTNDCEKILDYLHFRHAPEEALHDLKRAWKKYIDAVFKEWDSE